MSHSDFHEQVTPPSDWERLVAKIQKSCYKEDVRLQFLCSFVLSVVFVVVFNSAMCCEFAHSETACVMLRQMKKEFDLMQSIRTKLGGKWPENLMAPLAFFPDVTLLRRTDDGSEVPLQVSIMV
jgi:hypothetical protein